VQLVVLEAKTSAGHDPDVPVQFSARSHWPAGARQTVVLDWKPSTHVLSVPEQWSAESSSHAPPWDAPAQLVVSEANPSPGHAPDAPVHVSATSHWPADARQTVTLDW